MSYYSYTYSHTESYNGKVDIGVLLIQSFTNTAVLKIMGCVFYHINSISNVGNISITYEQLSLVIHFYA